MPIDLDIPESYLFRFADDRGTLVVSVPGRTEAEARHRWSRMTAAEKRAAAVGRIEAHAHDRDLVADFGRWVASLARPRLPRRA